MIQYGKRIIVDATTGRVLNNTFEEMQGDLQENLRPGQIAFIDLPFGYNGNNFKDAASYHIDTTKLSTNDLTQIIVIDEYVQRGQTPEERIQELENQILLMADATEGGIL